MSFYMYLLFLVPHKGVPLATFDLMYPFFLKSSMVVKISMILALIGIVYFSYKHFALLVKNIVNWNSFKNTDEYGAIKGTLREVSFMAIPLTYAMTVNVFFVLGAAFVPGLWSIIEYMFPIAIAAFLAVGIYAFKIFADYFVPFVINGNQEWENNNDLTQLLSIFAFAMIGVGFAAPGAMSHIKAVNAIGIFFSFFFITAAALLGLLKLVLNFHAIVKNGINEKASPSLWIMIPILTLIGITVVRDSFGLAHHFSEGAEIKAFLFSVTGSVFALQTLIGVFGYLVMKRLNYFADYIGGDKKDPVTYALICPGVAYFVFGMFFIHWGLIFNGVIAKYSIAHFVMIALLALVQIKTVITVLRLNKKFSL